MKTKLCLLAALGLALVGRATGQTFTSGETRVHLVELFTSEGCSSCPPADKWLTELRTQKGLWTEFVPVSWHVDYWDDLGWKDRFSSAWATNRERSFAKLWKTTTIYTPCIVVDGAESGAGAKGLKASAARAGVLSATYDAGKIMVNFPSTAQAYEVHAAILGGGIVSKVTRGENSGSTLKHEFVVLAEEDAELRDGRANIALAIPAKAGVPDHYLAVWLTAKGSLVAVQATGGAIK